VKKKAPAKFKKIFKKKPCRLCQNKVDDIDYKNVDFLQRYISDKGKIVPSRLSGNCAKHQRMVSNRIKRARVAGLLPFFKVKQGAQRERNFASRR